MAKPRNKWESVGHDRRSIESLSSDQVVANFSADDGCIDWRGTMNNHGYGRVGRHNAHRFVYESVHGKLPSSLHVDHLCRNRQCVNLNHMEPVTRVENIMRGESPAAKNARKTHCSNGHPFSGDNLMVVMGRYRACRQCAYAKSNQRRRRLIEESGRSVQIPTKDRTHCPSGHEYNEKNTYVNALNRRVCRTCSAAKRRAYNARRKAEANA